MTLLDVNVLLALVDPLHAHHERAKHFFVNRHPAAWATCPIVENGFLRVLSGTGGKTRRQAGHLRPRINPAWVPGGAHALMVLDPQVP